MAQVFSLTFNLAAALQTMNVALSTGVLVATARAINRTADSEKVALSRAIATDMGIQVGVVKAAITVEKATTHRLTAFVIAKGARLPLIDLRASGPTPSRGRGRGVSYRVFGTTRRLPHAFIAKMASGHVGVFGRSGKARLPIHEKFGPSIAHVFRKQVPLGEDRREAVLLKNVQHEIEFALARSA